VFNRNKFITDKIVVNFVDNYDYNHRIAEGVLSCSAVLCIIIIFKDGALTSYNYARLLKE